MGKTRHLFKKIRDTKGTFFAKIGSVKDINGMDLTEAIKGISFFLSTSTATPDVGQLFQ